MITQKDLRQIARVLQNIKPVVDLKPIGWRGQQTQEDVDFELVYEGRVILWVQAVAAFADMLAYNNPKFKRSIFYKACEYDAETLT